eukprot:TRINITY_DN619_c0_g1_i2.p1 TRINITY_DN619_c0_g1~~TRINITY_DN619_c0_g1_i2.p1  ORF type:complete len:217 (-),score=48.58 TRINITY_DN619_c0_g1_i2:49-699(-)
MVFVRITRPDNHTILQLIEPGMIGKIGMNSKGVGVTLNYLYYKLPEYGLPIHVVLRHFLDSSTLEEGKDTLGSFKYKKTSNIIFGSESGDFINFEFGGDVVYETDTGSVFVHTNHYLMNSTMNNDKADIDSYERYDRVIEMLSENPKQTTENAKKILKDTANEEYPICRSYIPDPDLGEYGTLISMFMNLKEGSITATSGYPFENGYITIPVVDVQ